MMQGVRTTVTLEPDAEALVKRLMRERDMSFKQAVNHAIRTGLTPAAQGKPFRTRTHDLGVRAGVDLDKALQLAGEFEDQEIVRELQRGK
jgi:hypothetical protein